MQQQGGGNRSRNRTNRRQLDASVSPRIGVSRDSRRTRTAFGASACGEGSNSFRFCRTERTSHTAGPWIPASVEPKPISAGARRDERRCSKKTCGDVHRTAQSQPRLRERKCDQGGGSCRTRSRQSRGLRDVSASVSSLLLLEGQVMAASGRRSPTSTRSTATSSNRCRARKSCRSSRGSVNRYRRPQMTRSAESRRQSRSSTLPPSCR